MTDQTVVLVGSPQDAHVAAIARAVEGRGVEAVVVDTLSFPDGPRITLGERLADVTIDGRPLSNPACVYVRDVYTNPLGVGVDADEEMTRDWRRTLVAFREKGHMLFGLVSRWSELGVPVYNPMAPDWRLAKPLQLAVLEAAGLPVPRTVWTNDPDRVRSFADGRRVAYKPVAGGAATRELEPRDLTDERLRALRGAPVTFQDLMAGADHRVFCLDGEVVGCCRILSRSLDYRQHEDVVEEATLPDPVLDRCRTAMEALGLRWAAIDLKEDADGTNRFLEANSSPMFLGFDAQAGTNVLDALADRLVSYAH